MRLKGIEMNENDIDEEEELAASWEEYELSIMREQYEAEQAERDLPPHKQVGYFERMMEEADHRKTLLRENGK